VIQTHAGQKTLTSRLFIERGGTLMINRRICPAAQASRCSQIALMCHDET